ncbi:MAG: hypothetical protein GEU81_10140 [Nitriliruptorales bacterium]|nr:hypothetical protein [Nitriliruptorales bacterium]
MSDTQRQAPPKRPRSAGFLGGARTLFHVRGIPVRADVSLLLMAGLVIFIVYGQLTRPAGGPLLGQSTTVVIVAAAAYALLFFASILAHEFGHAFTSLDRDIPVLGITLFALGGVTESAREADRARDEFVIVGIGPFISLLLAAAAGLLYVLFEPYQVPAAVLGYIAWTNLLLAIFNLVPGYPLDGGRLLRSVLWAITRRPHRATRWAARVGQVFALSLILIGIAGFLRLDVLPIGGLWEALIGFFLLRGATDAHRRARVRERLAERTVRQLMGSVPPTLAANLAVGEAVEQVSSRPSLLWPVGSPLVGAVTLAQLDRVPDGAWPTTTVADVAFPADQVTIDADASMDKALDRIADAPGNMLLVMNGTTPIGLLTPSLVTHVAS